MFGLEWFRPARERRMPSTASVGDILMPFFLSFLGLVREGSLDEVMMYITQTTAHGTTQQKRSSKEMTSQL